MTTPYPAGDLGASLTGPGSRPSDRTPSDFAPAGIHPSRTRSIAMFAPVETALVEKLYNMNERFRCEHSGGETAPFLREAADEIMRLLRERNEMVECCTATHSASLAWCPPDSVLPNLEVEVRVGVMTFLAKLVPGAAMNTDETPCDQWQATREGEHPPCWSDGACWENNADCETSMSVEAWRPVGKPICHNPARYDRGECCGGQCQPAPGIDARSAETSGSARQGESPVTEGQAPFDQRGPA